ncbi:MAG: glycosyltransferase [Micavibrio sp.]|nr:glycosyltransferase [Micavibrio sp.]|tara:strand:+ start:342 stop:1385 length:1044 start_codon:yes stop_codon:yes gene_type:complete
MDLSVVIPCYNEEESLTELHRRVLAACKSAPVKTFEIILVNDGSTDSTLSIMTTLCDKDPHVVIVNLSRNHGHQLALSAGLGEAQGDYIFVLDADLQDPPELLTPMLERAKSGVDVVYGQRAERQGETWFKLFCSKSFYRVLSFLSETDIPENVGDFRLMSRRVLDQLLSMPEQQRFIRGMIAWIGFKQEPFLYERDARYAGVTKYPFMKLMSFAIDAISSFSIRPLRIAIPFALIGGVLAGLLGLGAVYSHFTGGTITGWTSLACIITGFAAIQLLCIALIGEYVGRMYIEVKRRPLYIVADVIRADHANHAGAKPTKKTAPKIAKKTAAKAKSKTTKAPARKKAK